MKIVTLLIAFSTFLLQASAQDEFSDELKLRMDQKTQAIAAGTLDKETLNKRYQDALLQLVLRAKLGKAPAATQAQIKTELANTGYYAPEDWYQGLWSFKLGSLNTFNARLNFDGMMLLYYKGEDIPAKDQRELIGYNVINASKVTFKYKDREIEMNKLGTGKTRLEGWTYLANGKRTTSEGTAWRLK